jgi:hypothetical protein
MGPASGTGAMPGANCLRSGAYTGRVGAAATGEPGEAENGPRSIALGKQLPERRAVAPLCPTLATKKALAPLYISYIRREPATDGIYAGLLGRPQDIG